MSINHESPYAESHPLHEYSGVASVESDDHGRAGSSHSIGSLPNEGEDFASNEAHYPSRMPWEHPAKH